MHVHAHKVSLRAALDEGIRGRELAESEVLALRMKMSAQEEELEALRAERTSLLSAHTTAIKKFQVGAQCRIKIVMHEVQEQETMRNVFIYKYVLVVHAHVMCLRFFSNKKKSIFIHLSIYMYIYILSISLSPCLSLSN